MDHFHASAKIYTKRLTTCKDEKHILSLKLKSNSRAKMSGDLFFSLFSGYDATVQCPLWRTGLTLLSLWNKQEIKQLRNERRENTFAASLYWGEDLTYQ